MKKKKILNALMVLVIAVIAVSGIMAVRSLKGPAVSDNGQGVAVHQPVIADKSGIVTVERKGIAYEVDENTEVKNGDILRTKVSSEISICENGKVVITLGADTEVRVLDAQTMALQLAEGELFIDSRNTEKAVTIATDGAVFSPENAVFSVTAYSSAYTAHIYSGEVTAGGEKIKESVIAEKGKIISAVVDENGNISAMATSFLAQGLNQWQIEKLLKCNMDESFCFTSGDLDKVVADREAEKQAARQALLEAQQQAIAELEKQQKEYDENYQKYLDAIKNGAQVSTDADGNIVVSTPANSCTLEIRCDTILSNMSDLTDGKEGYVPSNGTILSTVRISFEEGETVFDVLKRACSATGIQLEYSWTPMYNSYYIEGINNLYEFDCGAESGWMYKVNGWFPNYGCSSYPLKDGDTIVWCYTCKGLGADVGGSVYG